MHGFPSLRLYTTKGKEKIDGRKKGDRSFAIGKVTKREGEREGYAKIIELGYVHEPNFLEECKVC